LSGIAQKFGISLQTLLWANGMTSKSVLAVGKELTILPVSGVQHTVKSGDSLLAIAKKYNVSAAEIAKTNASKCN
jgi:spore germination protein